MSQIVKSSEAGSLVLGNGMELDLGLGVDDAGLPARAYERAEEFGRFTGERIFSTNPKLYRAIVALLARGVPYREISEICSVSVNTVCAVSQREGVPIETIRERIARIGFDVSMLTVEAMRDMLADPVARAKLTMKDLAVAHGIVTQNAQLLAGGVTARLDYADRAPAPGHDDYLAFLRKAKDVTGSGSSGESAEPIGADAAGLEPVIEVPSTSPYESKSSATTQPK